MAYTESDLRAAAVAGLLEGAQLTRLLEFLRAHSASATGEAPPAPRFDVAHLLWYAGALIVMTAMGLFSTLAFSQMGGQALAATALIYAAAFAAAGHHLWHRDGLRTPGGLLIAVAVSMAPLAVYGIQDALAEASGHRERRLVWRRHGTVSESMEERDDAIDEVSDAARRLLASLETTRPARDRDAEAMKARARARERFA